MVGRTGDASPVSLAVVTPLSATRRSVLSKDTASHIPRCIVAVCQHVLKQRRQRWTFEWISVIRHTTVGVLLSPVYTIQPVVKPTGWTSVYTIQPVVKRMSKRLSNRFHNRLYHVPVYKHSTGCWQPAVSCIQPVVKPVWQLVERLYTQYNQLSTRL